MKITTILCTLCTVLLCWSCDSDLEKALKNAGENRSELEKVLEHFENDSDPLKYEAARFLIENMASHFHSSGLAVEEEDSIYLSAIGESQNTRTQYFNNATSSIDYSQSETVCDISVMKADYLIKVINDACEVWNHSSWHKDFDKSIFFEYVLPYRLVQEPMSDWRETINQEFPMLRSGAVISRRGLQYEAEEGQCVGCETVSNVGASNGRAEIMFPGKSSVAYTVVSECSTQKRLIMRYSSIAKNLSVNICVNDSVMEKIYLTPTHNMESYSEKWFNFSISLSEGKNVVSFISASDTLCLDYIQLGAVETYKRKDLDVYNLSDIYYSLENFKSKQYLSFDTAFFSKNHVLSLKPYSESDSTQLLRMDYAGYALWRMGYYKRNDTDLCLQMEFGVPNTLHPGAPVSVGEYVKRPFDQWIFFPLGIDLYRIMNKFTGLFLDIEKDPKTGREILVQNPFSKSWTQEWVMHRRGKNPFSDSYYRVGSAMSEAMRVFDLTHQSEYYINSRGFETKASSLFKAKSGICTDEISFTIFICRYLGIPATYDFTPHWGNRSSNYSWCVLVNPDGKSTPFYMGNVPGDTVHHFHSYSKPKVFRYRYSLNKEMMKDFSSEKSAPALFVNPHYTDVTDEYCKTTDIVRPVPSEYNDRVVYICVFDNRTWVPVYYGKADDEKVTFKAMGRGIVYTAAILDKGRMVPIGSPFLLTEDGKIKEQK